MKIRSRWISRIAAWLLVTGFRTLLATCRKIDVAPDSRLQIHQPTAVDQPERFLLSVWHDELILPTFGAHPQLRRQTCCLVSKHQDGGYLADAMTLLGYATVRGSSNKGGAAALKQLLDDTAEKHIVITPDGPRGPRREMKAGPVYLASQLGRRICCGAYACKRGWRINGSWTDMLIPLPFTTIYLVTSEPLAIKPDLSRDELHAEIMRVQAEMDRLNHMAQRLVSGQPAEETPRQLRQAA